MPDLDGDNGSSTGRKKSTMELLRSDDFYPTCDDLVRKSEIPIGNSSGKAAAVLIRVIYEIYPPGNIESDLLLMAFGLLQGYSHAEQPISSNIDGITWRRSKFLFESTYLEADAYPIYKTAYMTSDMKAIRSACESLRGPENKAWKKVLAELGKKKDKLDPKEMEQYVNDASTAYRITKESQIQRKYLPQLVNVREIEPEPGNADKTCTEPEQPVESEIVPDSVDPSPPELPEKTSKMRRWFPIAAGVAVILALCLSWAHKPDTNMPPDPHGEISDIDAVAEIDENTSAETIIDTDVDLDNYIAAFADVCLASEFSDPSVPTGITKITVERDKEYTIRLHVYHNRHDNMSASPARVYFDIPKSYGSQATGVAVTGAFYAQNLSPNAESAAVSFTGDDIFYLEYVPGSARIYNEGIGTHVLSDSIMENGVLIGYDTLNGIVPSGEEYGSYITIRVRAIFDIEFTVEEMVRRQGDKEWEQSVDAVPGDLLEFLILYKNISPVTQNNVVIRNVLPDNLSYEPGNIQTGTGNTYLFNVNHPSGAVNNDDGAIVGTGINIGNYTAGSNAYVIFTARVVDNSLADGTTKVVSWGQCGVGTTTLQDSASVFAVKE